MSRRLPLLIAAPPLLLCGCAHFAPIKPAAVRSPCTDTWAAPARPTPLAVDYRNCRIPLQLDPETSLLIAATQVNERAAPLAVDCGTSFTDIRADLAGNYVLDPGVPANHLTQTPGGAIRSRTTLVKDFRIGDIAVRNCNVDLTHAPIERRLQVPWVGMLGTDLLLQLGAVIDVPKRELRFENGCDSEVPSKELVPVLMDQRLRVPVVKIVIGGKQRYFIVDTGASKSIVFKSSGMHGLGPTEAARFHSAAGSYTQHMTKLPKFCLGPWEVAELRAWLNDSTPPLLHVDGSTFRADGCIGNDLLVQCSLVVDLYRLALYRSEPASP